MFYRRKVILALLQTFGGELEKIRLQKLLFLFSKNQEKPVYDFIPYKYGCYSYSATADMTAMVKREFLTSDEKHYRAIDKQDYVAQLKEDDRRILLAMKGMYRSMSSNDLMEYTYKQFPFYATRSEVASSILDAESYQQVLDSKPTSNKTILFTIGYEGISLEEYLVRLLQNDVKMLVDVRNNPLSMKYGFSKSQLERYCKSIDIKYIHLPEVGIQSNQRRELKTQEDYDALFEVYRKENLPSTISTQSRIVELLQKHKRIALTCFESNICQCHRKHLAEAIEMLPDFTYTVQHI
ncbi:MAG: DUF488 domain-containing protein [Candidatus Kapabacteria bacterium]|nr:DUF488 domain-containing protein [Candidatus Kapabacteria bacterium]